VIIPGPVESWMGSPRTEAERFFGPEGTSERRHHRRIGRSFALAAHEVTVEQFLKFLSDHDYSKPLGLTPEHPINTVTWFDAAGYCNWLSEAEGIPEDQWCYEPNAMKQYAAGMRVKPDALTLHGYRLPTEAEWEYACRAGVADARYYGESKELLSRHAWHTLTSLDRIMALPGSFRPNDLGLFDMLGNALEWCADPRSLYTSGTRGEPKEDNLYIRDFRGIGDTPDRLLRGGSYLYQPGAVRSAYCYWNRPAFRSYDVGLRPARTYP
jgi:formylglycine-generating enzyme required for sulfatase activity